jgi:hypothetical protein
MYKFVDLTDQMGCPKAQMQSFSALAAFVAANHLHPQSAKFLQNCGSLDSDDRTPDSIAQLVLGSQQTANSILE